MKKLFTMILVSLFVVSLATSALAEIYVVLTEHDPLLVRDAPYGGNPIGQYPKFTLVEGEKYDKFRVKINYNGQEGYMYSGYLMTYDEYMDLLHEDAEDCYCQEDDFYPEVTPAPYVHHYTPGDINSIYTIDTTKVKEFIRVFKKNDSHSEVLGTIGIDELVYVITLGPTYTKVFYDGHVGYILTKNIVFYMELLPEAGELYSIKLNHDTTLRLWSRKSEESTIVIRLFNGMFVKVLSNDGEWAKVSYNQGGDTAFVRSRYLVPATEND